VPCRFFSTGPGRPLGRPITLSALSRMSKPCLQQQAPRLAYRRHGFYSFFLRTAILPAIRCPNHKCVQKRPQKECTFCIFFSRGLISGGTNDSMADPSRRLMIRLTGGEISYQAPIIHLGKPPSMGALAGAGKNAL